MKFLFPSSFFRGRPKNQIILLDSKTEEVKIMFEEFVPDVVSILGKGITGIERLDTDRIVACDFNRIFIVNLKTGEKEKTCFNKEFNDLHNISIFEHKIYAVNTGLDSIEEFNFELEWLKRYSFLEGNESQERIQGKYTVNEDYYTPAPEKTPFYLRKVPNKFHFNNLVSVNDRQILCSLKKQSFFDLKTKKCISNHLNCMPHDGFIYKNEIWISLINGEILKSSLDKPSLHFEAQFNLFKEAKYQGWCRGIHVVEDILYVAITEIYEKNSRTEWLTAPLKDTKTGIYVVDIKQNTIIDWIDLSHENGRRIFKFIPAEMP